MALNVVVLLGRLTADPNVRYTNTGTCCANFTLAVDRRVKDGQDTADFLRCTAFGKCAETIEKYVKKGRAICVDGRIQTGSYTDRDGKKVYTTDIIVERFDFAGSDPQHEGNAQAASGKQAASGGSVPMSAPGEFAMLPDDFKDEDLPFN